MNNFFRITSRRNPFLNEVLELATPEGRQEKGLCFAEGFAAAEFIAKLEKGRVQAVILSEDASEKNLQLAEKFAKGGSKAYLLTPECYAKISALRHPEGLGLLVTLPEPIPNTEALPKNAPVACLWQLQDPGNLGTIVRSAAAFGCRDFLLVTPSVSPFHPAALRSSAGAALQSHFLFLPENEALDYLSAQGKRVVALSGDGDELTGEICYNKSDALVVSGNEAHGLPLTVRKALPLYSFTMKGKVESLNVTAASAIAYYLFWSQPTKK